MSRVTAIISALVICIIVCLSWAVNHYRDNAITYKAQRDKNARELKLANAAITDMQMRHAWCCCASMQKYTKELADAKAENDALRDDVAAGRRRLYHQSSLSVSAWSHHAASGVDNAASPDWQTLLNGDYFTFRERLITMQNNRSGSCYINEQIELPISMGNSCNYCEQYTRASAEYKCLVQNRAISFTNVCWVSVLTTFSALPQILAASTVFFCPIPETKKWWVMVSLVLLLPVCFEQ